MTYFFFLYGSPSLLSLCTVFYSISSNTDHVLLINPSANLFVFGGFNVHHTDCLTFRGRTDRSDELCYNFSILNFLTQMINVPTSIPDCCSHSPTLLDFFLSSDASIFSTMTFPPLGNSDYVVSVSIDFPSYSQQDILFITLLMIILILVEMVFVIISEMFHERIYLNLVLLLLLVNFVSGFRL